MASNLWFEATSQIFAGDEQRGNGTPFGHFRLRDQFMQLRHFPLDHLEFLVDQRSDLDEWAARLDALGIVHSGVKEPSHTQNAMLTFRDPDNIQLEFFWRRSLRPLGPRTAP